MKMFEFYGFVCWSRVRSYELEFHKTKKRKRMNNKQLAIFIFLQHLLDVFSDEVEILKYKNSGWLRWWQSEIGD